MMKETKMKRVPKLRFPEFTDDWEQRKLSEMCGTFEYGLNAAAKEFDGKNKYIRITDIDDASREFLLSDLSSPDICLDGMSKYLLSSGDIVFARTGASVGKTYIYRENDGIVYFAGFLIRAKVNKDNDAEFVFQSTLSPSYEKYIRITSQRSGQPGVNAQEYGEYDLFVPSKEEQQRIGQFLRGIDNLITLHQRKLEKLKELRKGVMQKLFSQEVRFKADDGSEFPEWEKKPFGDVVSEFKVKTKVEDEDTLLSCAINGMFLNSELFGHQRGHSNIGYLKIKKGTLILSAQNLHLGNANVNLRFEHGIISPAYKTYDIVGCSAEYMSQWVKWDMTKQFFYNATTVGASECRRNVDWNMLYSQLFAVPCLAEQQKIADCLSSLDEVIEKQKATLAAWEELKKGLLQQMFV